MKRVAIIPARGGSKRIPGKNIKHFLGRPMISYPINAIKDSGLFERIIVSTDDEEIAEVARQEGAEVPFMRPADLSDDFTGTGPVTNHAIDWLISQNQKPDYVCCVYATTPLLTSEYLKKGWELLIESGRKFAFSVASFPFPIQRALKMTKNSGIIAFQPECIPMRSQDLEPAFHDAGQFYWGKTDAFLGDGNMLSDDTAPVVLPRYLVQDIDDEEDWRRAELMYQVLYVD